jgi:hypothetical protein
VALPLANSFETGLADETAITAVNSDIAGHPFDAIGGECLYDNLRAAHGSLSMKGVVDAVEVANIDWSTAIGTVTEMYTRLYLYMTAWPTSTMRLIRTKNSSAADVSYVQIGNDGIIYAVDATSFSSPATLLPINEWVRFEWRLLASTTVGINHLRIYQADSATILDEVTRTSVNTGVDIDVLAIGNCTSSNVGTFWLDDLAVSGTDWIGPALTVVPQRLDTRGFGPF